MANGAALGMNMGLSNAISLGIISEGNEVMSAQCDVLLNGINTGIKVTGKVLEASFRVSPNRYLLFITDDIIFEESLNITLIDINYGVLESLDLGGQYVTGSFEELLIKSNSIKFRFIGDTVWTVEPLAFPSLRMPFNDPRGVKRSFGLKKYLNISANPYPARANGRR